MNLSGDFNTNFAELTSKPLVEFFNNTFGLEMSNKPTELTTRLGTTIDAVFDEREANNVRSVSLLSSMTVTYYRDRGKPDR
ncbi:hypothetical protein PV325_002147 [Microctonus aethiopoides]|nr:hypothetical protein PV325_002147 [Microctonus aethiopoides]